MPDTALDRRGFIGAAAALAATAAAPIAGAARAQPQPAPRPAAAPAAGPIAIASGNGLKAVARARELLLQNADPLDACVDGVRIVEDDPDDMTVGLGGLPNEEGVVELDASVMHGPMHRAGAVASLRNIRNPAAVAREVARRTDHVLLVGEGALRFALRNGFTEENLLTDKARRAWLSWRSTLSRTDDWLQPDEFDLPTPPDPRDDAATLRRAADLDPHLALDLQGVLHTYGTIHLSARTAAGDLAGCTTTSGLSWKLPGRVGDSPILGAGLYTDNDVGSAGSTGRGEANLQICGSRFIVMRMSLGDHPTEACLAALRMVADKTRSRRLLDSAGEPDFDLTFYALRKDGAVGAATLRARNPDLPPDTQQGKFALADDAGARLVDATPLFGPLRKR